LLSAKRPSPAEPHTPPESHTAKAKRVKPESHPSKATLATPPRAEDDNHNKENNKLVGTDDYEEDAVMSYDNVHSDDDTVMAGSALKLKMLEEVDGSEARNA
jgi:hypothetical protein